MSENSSSGQPPAEAGEKLGRSKSIVPRAGLLVVVLIVAFLLGFVPMWLKSTRLGHDRDGAEMRFRRVEVELALANATLDARRGEYERARQEASDFFTLCRTELDRGTGSAVPAAARPEAEKALKQRDDLITLLARGDPAAAERLANMYVAFRSGIEPK